MNKLFHFLLFATVFVGPSLPTAIAQTDDAKTSDDEKTETKAGRSFAKKPLLRMWYSLDEFAISEYMRDVLADYGVENKMMLRAMDAGQKDIGQKPELAGMIVLIVKGVIPSAVQLQFRTVDDQKEFRHQVMRVRNQMGEAGTLSGSGDHYVLNCDFTQGIPIPGNDADGDGKVDLFKFPGQDQIGNNPAAMQQLKQEIHFRRIDDLMWQGQIPELADMELPIRSQLRPAESMLEYDVYGEFNLEEIPQYLKSLLFNTLNMTARAQLQQRDKEDDINYAARRANGDMWLELVRTVFYDVNKGRFTLKSTQTDRPVELRLDLSARKGSQLEKVGGQLDVGQSRFGAIRNRDVPLSIASTWGMPKMMQKLLSAQMAVLRREADSEKIPDASSYNQLLDLLDQTVDSGRVDTLFQITGSANSGYALLGGMKLDSPDEFQETLSAFLSSFERVGAITWSEDKHANRYFSIDTGNINVPGRKDVSFTSNVHLTVHDGCLWVSYGGPAALDLLQESVQWTMDNPGNSSDELFQFTFDLSRLLQGEDTDDADGVKQFPRRAALEAERKMEQAINGIFAGMSRAMQRGKEPRDKDFEKSFRDSFSEPVNRPSFLLKAMETDQDEIDLRVNISKKGIRVNLDIGQGLANMFVARMMDFQGRAIEAMFQMQAASATR